MAFSITTLRIRGLYVTVGISIITLSITTLYHYAEYHFAKGCIFYCYAECHYAERRYAGCQ
jgi:hypothetical protein